MIGQFELMKRMVACANVDGQGQLAELIASTDFSKNKRALDVAASCFLLTKVNVKENQAAAMKLVRHQCADLRFTVVFRLELLSDLLGDIEAEAKDSELRGRS